MRSRLNGFFSACILALLGACNSADHSADKVTAAKTPAIREEAVNLRSGSSTLHSFVYSDTASNDRRAAIIVVPEWWGLTDYARGRARQLAGLGYTAIALDMYGDGKVATDPKQAQEFAMPFYTNPALFAERLQTALTYLKTRPEADSARMGAMGYCFGGSAVLHGARLGLPFRGVVSFHGDFPEPGQPWQKDAYTGKILICHGEADSFVPMEKFQAFTKRLDSLNIAYTARTYKNATHAFTNPAATETGKKFNMPIRYDGAADTASWADMKAFWADVFH